MRIPKREELLHQELTELENEIREKIAKSPRNKLLLGTIIQYIECLWQQMINTDHYPQAEGITAAAEALRCLIQTGDVYESEPGFGSRATDGANG